MSLPTQIGSEDDQSDIENSISHYFIFRIEGSDGFYYYGTEKGRFGARYTPQLLLQKLSFQEQGVEKHFASLGWDNVKVICVQQMLCNPTFLLREQLEIFDDHLTNPLCLNANVNQISIITEQIIDIIYCECGERVLHTDIEAHRLTTKHLQNLLMAHRQTTQNVIKVLCECGEQVNKRNITYHRTTETHLWNLRIKHMAPIDFNIPIPPAIPTPKGYRTGMIYCRCQCQMIVDRKNFCHHLKTSKHARALMEAGIIPIPEVKIIVDEIPVGKYRCECGEILCSRYTSEHCETAVHKRKMAELVVVKGDVEEQESPDDITLPLDRASRRRVPVECECGSIITSSAFKSHRESALHRTRMERREKGLPSPIKKLSRFQEFSTCECGTPISRENRKTHLKSQEHKDYEAKKLLEV